MSLLRKLNMMDFIKLIPTRESKIQEAKAQKLPENSSYKANQLAAALHPKAQNMIITDVKELNADAKLFTFCPDKEGGTKSFAYFSSGQYLSITFEIGSVYTTRAYTICSSPAQSVKGVYKILVKRASDGFVSEYILNNWKIGTKVHASAPFGNFCFEPLRDSKNVIGIAGGSGITAFYSMAQAICENSEDFNLTILYGSKTQKDILLKNELEELAASCNKIKIINVLSDEKVQGFENGFISSELIKKYAHNYDSYSVFVCGPKPLYDFEKTELPKLGLKQKFIRYELIGLNKNPSDYSDFPKEKAGKYVLTVSCAEEIKSISCSSNETLLVAMERAGIKAPSRCRSGICGWCHSKLIKGNVFIPFENDGRRIADSQFGYIHPCSAYPLSDISLEIFPVN